MPRDGPPITQRTSGLELNRTNEILTFKEIPGTIRNRGLLQDDIDMFGLWYLQQIQDLNAKFPEFRRPTEPLQAVRRDVAIVESIDQLTGPERY